MWLVYWIDFVVLICMGCGCLGSCVWVVFNVVVWSSIVGWILLFKVAGFG